MDAQNFNFFLILPLNFPEIGDFLAKFSPNFSICGRTFPCRKTKIGGAIVSFLRHPLPRRHCTASLLYRYKSPHCHCDDQFVCLTIALYLGIGLADRHALYCIASVCQSVCLSLMIQLVHHLFIYFRVCLYLVSACHFTVIASDGQL